VWKIFLLVIEKIPGRPITVFSSITLTSEKIIKQSFQKELTITVPQKLDVLSQFEKYRL
tara:strand:- start:770 stop:946 length:177 start_codon:yes stop_codon:yes gene_type:complete